MNGHHVGMISQVSPMPDMVLSCPCWPDGFRKATLLVSTVLEEASQTSK